jgi:hypothetical protein
VPVVPVVAVAVVPEVLVTVEYHRTIHSYISINGNKHCRNNCH